MTNVSYHDIEQARQREMTLRAQLRAERKAKRAELEAITAPRKAELAELSERIKAEAATERAAQYAALIADGGQEIAGKYVVKIRKTRGEVIPRDPSEAITKGSSKMISLMLQSLV